jgi:hypothetical protein
MKGKYMRRIGGIVFSALMLFGIVLVSAGDSEAQSRRRVIIVRPYPYRIYRPFGFRSWWNYPYGWGYDPWSPYGFRYGEYVFDNSDEAGSKGYEKGFKTGKDDGKKAKSFSPERSHYFKEAGFGNFAEVYRSAFARGYGEGFRAGANERARKNAG